MKLCLFSTYSESDKLDNYIKFYLENLLPHFDKIIVITNDDRTINDDDILFLNKLGKIEVKYVTNEGFDFGMWYKALQDIEDLSKIKLLGLVNDSCVLFRNLNPFFKWVSKSNHDFYGITDSHQYEHHLQSYFLVCKRAAVKSLYQFFMDNGIKTNKDVRETIFNYEIGLSSHLKNLGFKISSFYKTDDYKKINISLMSAREMINNGCPMIKKKLLNKSFRGHERSFLLNHGFDFSINYERVIRKISYTLDDNVNINYLLDK